MAVSASADIRASIDRLERARAARTAANSTAAALHQIDRGQLAVTIDAQLDLLLRIRTVAGRSMLIPAREHHLDRNAGRLGEARRCNNFGSRAEFRSEAAAEKLADDTHIVRRQIEVYGQVVAHGKNSLRRAPDRELITCRIEDRDRAMRLEADVGLHRGRVGRLDRVRRNFESSRDIADARVQGPADIGSAAEHAWR